MDFGARFLYNHIKKLIPSKCPPLHESLFHFFYFEEIKERISQGCEGFSPRKLRRLRWFLREVKLYHSLSIYLTARSRGVAPNSAFSYFLSAEA